MASDPFAAEIERRGGAQDPFAAELARRQAQPEPAGTSAGDLAMGVLFPHHLIGEALGVDSPQQFVERAGEQLAGIPDQLRAVAGMASDPERQARGRTLAELRALEEGRPGAEITDQEALAEVLSGTTQAAAEGAIAGVAPSVGGRVAQVAQSVPRYLGRGARTIPEARRAASALQAEQIATGVVDERSATGKILAELAKSAVLPTVAGAATTPVLGPLGPLTGAGGAIVSTLLRLRPATADLLANHPGFRSWALSSGANPTGAGAKIGALVGLAATAGPEVATAVRAFVDELERDDQPQPRQPRRRRLPGGGLEMDLPR